MLRSEQLRPHVDAFLQELGVILCVAPPNRVRLENVARYEVLRSASCCYIAGGWASLAIALRLRLHLEESKRNSLAELSSNEMSAGLHLMCGVCLEEVVVYGIGTGPGPSCC